MCVLKVCVERGIHFISSLLFLLHSLFFFLSSFSSPSIPSSIPFFSWFPLPVFIFLFFHFFLPFSFLLLSFLLLSSLLFPPLLFSSLIFSSSLFSFLPFFSPLLFSYFPFSSLLLFSLPFSFLLSINSVSLFFFMAALHLFFRFHYFSSSFFHVFLFLLLLLFAFDLYSFTRMAGFFFFLYDIELL